MDMNRFRATIKVRGEELEYDPEAREALVSCEKCGHPNVVPCSEEAGEMVFYGFSCENCGTWNAPE